jgi:hypothetical protein
MSRRKIVLAVLLIIPVFLLILSLWQSYTDSGIELIYLFVGVPILVLNAWEWTAPEVLDRLCDKKPQT